MSKEAMRAVVNVATNDYFRKGQARLIDALRKQGEEYHMWGELPMGCPPDVPYAFKAFALQQANYPIVGKSHSDYRTLLWCDSCILPIRPLAPVWEKIERDGYLIMDGGWTNYEWTADSAYPDLFPDYGWHGIGIMGGINGIQLARETNRTMSHVVAGCFGISLQHEIGRAILAEYYRLASETRAFCGPRWNSHHPDYGMFAPGAAPCGPPDVRGHRNDQSALSVIAWRLGCKLSQSPEYFSYAKDGSTDPADYDERTVLIAHGGY